MSCQWSLLSETAFTCLALKAVGFWSPLFAGLVMSLDDGSVKIEYCFALLASVSLFPWCGLNNHWIFPSRSTVLFCFHGYCPSVKIKERWWQIWNSLTHLRFIFRLILNLGEPYLLYYLRPMMRGLVLYAQIDEGLVLFWGFCEMRSMMRGLDCMMKEQLCSVMRGCSCVSFDGYLRRANWWGACSILWRLSKCA